MFHDAPPSTKKNEKKKETNERSRKRQKKIFSHRFAAICVWHTKVVKKSFLLRNKKKPRKLFFHFLFTRETSTQLRNFGSVSEQKRVVNVKEILKKIL